MRSEARAETVSRKRLWAGRITSAFPVLMLFFSGIMKLPKPAFVVEEFARLGYPESLVLAIGILELACAVVYVIPRTSVLGAILLTGYLGGATATHVRIGDSFYPPVVDETPVWLGLFPARRAVALTPSSPKVGSGACDKIGQRPFCRKGI